jgi:CRISPR-associated exonuclease Cas4
VVFDDELRKETGRAAVRLHEIIENAETPAPVFGDKCARCSLFDVCMPKLTCGSKSAERYTTRMLAKPLSDEREEEA